MSLSIRSRFLLTSGDLQEKDCPPYLSSLFFVDLFRFLFLPHLSSTETEHCTNRLQMHHSPQGFPEDLESEVRQFGRRVLIDEGKFFEWA
jgi:hypothetical protein